MTVVETAATELRLDAFRPHTIAGSRAGFLSLAGRASESQNQERRVGVIAALTRAITVSWHIVAYQQLSKMASSPLLQRWI